YGPFVMNTREEIEETIRDLRNGSFIQPESPLLWERVGVRKTCLKSSTDRASANKANCAWDAARPSSIKIAKKYCSPNAPTTGIGACPAVIWRQAKAPPKRVSAKCWRKPV